MPPIQYVGRHSEHFFGKYLSEIVRNLKNRGQGRVVIKETEAAKYPEPCFYVIERASPVMSDKVQPYAFKQELSLPVIRGKLTPTRSHVRCRLWARRICRGRDLGTGQILHTHEPDWRLAHPEEAERLLRAASDPKNAVTDTTVRCVAPMPPLLAVYLRRRGLLPDETRRKADAAASASSDHALTADEKEAAGLLLLTKLPWDPELFQVPIVPSEEEQGRIHPPYTYTSRDDLFTKPDVSGDKYYIRRSDTPGLYWKVILEQKSSSLKKATKSPD